MVSLGEIIGAAFKALDAAPDDATFVDLAAIAGLDPKTDFQHAGLSHSDFSNCDLRGFNFTGAVLCHSVGENVVWDETTILTDADLEGSIFATPGAPS